MKIVFVDGYNVLNNWPELKIEKEYNFQGSRQKLVDIMHNYASYINCKVVLVFDGYKVAGNLGDKEVINKNLTIIFTKDGQTADSYIEKEVSSLGRRYEIYVVTSDWLEQLTIFQRGAIRMSSVEFYNEVIKMSHDIKKLEKDKPSHNNCIQDNLDSNILRKLEEIRRSN